MLAAAGAVVGLWVGATRHTGSVARGYRWLGGAALFWCAGLIVDTVVAGSVSSSGEPLGLADVAPLLGLAAAATGIMVLASPSPSQRAAQQGEHPEHGTSGSVLPGLADGYVMAVALLVIGWVVAFGSEFHRSGERPSTFLLDLLHPLADLAVLGALLPVLTVAWRRVLVPYLALLVLTAADSLGVGARISGGHQGILEQLAMILAACLLGVAPWVPTIAARLGLPVWRSDGAPAGRAGRRFTRGAGSTGHAGHERGRRDDRGGGGRGGRRVGRHRERPGERTGHRPGAGHRRRRGRARGRDTNLHAGQGERRRGTDVAGVSRQPARPGGPDRRHGADLRPRRDDHLREPGRERLQLPAGGAGRQGSRGVRPSGGRRGDPGCGPAGARSRGECGHGGQRGAWRRGRYGSLLLPGARRGRDLAARRMRRAHVPAARRARADAGDGQGRQRRGRAAPAGGPPDVPRRADRPAEPRLRGGTGAGGARRAGERHPR